MGKTLNVTNPANGELVGALELTDAGKMQEIIQKANGTKRLWAETPLYRKTALMHKFLQLLEDNVEDIAVTLSKEMGKPIVQSRAETAGSVNIARAFAERANHLYGEVLPTDNQPGFEQDFIFTKREPLGVIACIIPFNYPIELFIHKVAPALMMGNVVIVKAPTKNPLAMMKLSALFEKAGFPDGVVQSLVCEREVSNEYLVAGKNIDAISLTGSTKAGVEMLKNGAATMKHIFLELGGNDGTIIREDADLDFAVEEVTAGRIFNAGQTCCACKRVIVHESIKDAFVEKLLAKFRGLKQGDALDETIDLSTVISEEAAKTIEKQIRHTIAQGAECITGGKRDGAFIQPTILTEVTKDMDVASDLEIFGPVIPVISYRTDEEAVEILNQPQYGLSSGIITKDVKKAMQMGTHIEAGAVVLNGQCSYRHMEQGFGGYKMTGHAREGVSSTLEEHSKTKHYIMKGIWGR